MKIVRRISPLCNREADFHDDWANTELAENVLVDESFTTITCPETRHVMKWLGNIDKKHILDIGCGCGEAAVYFAKRGATVTASDLSPGMLDLTRRVATFHGVTLTTVECSTERLPFPDATFDIVYGANVLHHSNLPTAVAEVRRVLKPGGRACFWDPLADNPAINIYRAMADKVRTPDEHPLTRQDIAFVRDAFEDVEVRYFWLLALLVFAKFYLIDWIHPNTERYWKKVIREADRVTWFYRPLAWLDRILLTVFPPARRFCWNVVICAQKAE